MREGVRGILIYFVLTTISLSGCIQTVPDKSSQYLEPESLAYVTPAFLNLRKCPSTECTIINTLKKGQELKVIEQRNSWSRVKVLTTGKTGWVSNTYIAMHTPKENPVEVSTGKTSAPENASEEKPLEEWAAPTVIKEKPGPAMPKEEWALPAKE